MSHEEYMRGVKAFWDAIYKKYPKGSIAGILRDIETKIDTVLKDR
jgi:hypothetical protein